MFSRLYRLFSDTPEYKMPPVRGKVVYDAPLAKRTWLGVGGDADVLFEPADEDDLKFFLEARGNIPVTVLGGGSNVLIRDGGIPGVVIVLGEGFNTISIDGDLIRCGGAVRDGDLAKAAYEAGLSGFEFLACIPGTLGGAVRMNAGANGSCIADRLVSMSGWELSGTKIEMTRDEIPFDYRTNDLPGGWIFTEIILKGIPENKQNIQKLMTEYRKIREKSQPRGVRTAGSMFKNPVGLKAWQLIEKAGCRGLRIGDAVVSEKHANFFVNVGDATAQDFEDLIETVRQRVWKTSEIMLEPEVRLMGVKTKDSG